MDSFRAGFIGKPDIVLPKYRTVIFVHGCFWHGHENCQHFRLPKSRRAWWKTKIEGNRARDLRNETALRSRGWHVVTIWECALKRKSDLPWLAQRLPRLVGTSNIEHRTSNIEHRTSNIEHRTSNIAGER